MEKPLIGVTTWRRPFDTKLGPGRPTHTLGTEYAAWIEQAGGIPVLLPPSQLPSELLGRIDGVVLSGGQDVRTSRYAGVLAPDIYPHDPVRDEFEIALSREARTRKTPVLAICRGLQVLNVAFGGSLVGDIDETEHHARVLPDARQLACRHPVTLAADSRLARTYGVSERSVNTIHHQAVATPGEGLRAVAWAPDGVIEAIEPTEDDWPVWAVQWHPEKLEQGTEADFESRLYQDFIEAATERRTPENSLNGYSPKGYNSNDATDLS